MTNTDTGIVIETGVERGIGAVKGIDKETETMIDIGIAMTEAARGTGREVEKGTETEIMAETAITTGPATPTPNHPSPDPAQKIPSSSTSTATLSS